MSALRSCQCDVTAPDDGTFGWNGNKSVELVVCPHRQRINCWGDVDSSANNSVEGWGPCQIQLLLQDPRSGQERRLVTDEMRVSLTSSRLPKSQLA
jgi:hypothetical protein